MTDVLLCAPEIGSGEDPLYWGPLLDGLARAGHRIDAFLARPIAARHAPRLHAIERIGLRSILGKRVPALRSLLRIGRHPARVVVLIEFSPLALLATLTRRLLAPRGAIVLLVENHPRHLAGYGIQRLGRGPRLLRRLQAGMATHIVTSNAEGRDYVERELGIASNRVSVFPYLTSCFDGLRCAASTTPLRIAIVGQLIPRKGIEPLLDELAPMAETLERTSTLLEIFGSGPDQERLAAGIVSRGLAASVVLRGSVPYADLGRHLSACNVFLIPTLADYRSLVSFEALSMGFPLIMSCRDGAAGEVVEPGGNGWIYDPLQPGRLRAILEQIIDDPDVLTPMFACSLARAQRFTRRIAVEGLDAVLRRVAP